MAQRVWEARRKVVADAAALGFAVIMDATGDAL